MRKVVKTLALLNKKEQIYTIIKERILKEEYQMGAPLNIRQISAELGVSNSPVREALNLLEKEGLVVISPNNVPRIVELNREDMFEISQMIFFWIVGAYRFCVHVHKTDELCEKMAEYLEKQKQTAASDDLHGYTHNSIYFDRCVIEVAGNKRLLMQFDLIYPIFYLCTLAIHRNEEERQTCVSQHEKILLATKEERFPDATDAFAEHYYQDAWGGESIR